MNWLGEKIEEEDKKYNELMKENPRLYDEAILDLIHEYTFSAEDADYEGDYKEDIEAVFAEDNVPFTDEAWDVIWRNTLTSISRHKWRQKLWKTCCHLLGSDPNDDFHQQLDEVIINADPYHTPLPAVWEEDGVTIPLFAIGERLLNPPS